MYHFTYWLEHFKELAPSKAQTIVKTISLLSDKTAEACIATGKLVDCKNLTTFQRIRQAILRAYGAELSQAEKRAISLYGDYWEFREYSSFKFPEAPTPMLLEYCKSMQMSYSYKAVLIYTLVKNGCTGVSTEQLVNSTIAFYRDRIDHGLIAEKEDSVFSKASLSFAAAKKVILANPVQVLTDAKVITWNKRTGIISLTGDYLPSTATACEEVCAACLERIKKYYSSIKLSKKRTPQDSTAPCSKKLQTLLRRLEAEIQNTTDKSAKKKLTTIYSSICAELGFSKNKKKKNSKSKPEKFQNKYVLIRPNDSRKIGAMVQDSMATLERIEYQFTAEQLNDMVSLEWSNTALKLNYPFFKKVDESRPIAEQRVDHLGNGRYYSRIFVFSGKKYLVTSQWYAKSKPFFIEWHNGLQPNTNK